jgi:hypothetical protein
LPEIDLDPEILTALLGLKDRKGKPDDHSL